MKWIFQQCSDTYGHCIRQYVTCALSFVIFFVSLYSMIRLKQNNKQNKFQMLPLLINTIATFIIAFIQFIQQTENIVIPLLIIQIYSYSLLVYAFTKLYLISVQKVTEGRIRNIRIGFTIYSILILILLISTSIYLFIRNLTCKDGQISYWYLSLTCVEVPIFIMALYYIFMTKKKIKQIQDNNQANSNQMQVLMGGDIYIRIKNIQTNCIFILFSFSMAVHIVCTILLFIFPFQCSNQTYFIVIQLHQLIILILMDFSNILPHILMPIVFFYVPAFFQQRGNTIYIDESSVANNNIDTLAGSNYQIDDKFRSKALKK